MDDISLIELDDAFKEYVKLYEQHLENVCLQFGVPSGYFKYHLRYIFFWGVNE